MSPVLYGLSCILGERECTPSLPFCIIVPISHGLQMKPIHDRCCCPTFFIAIAGPWMCILRVVFIDHVVIQELTDFIWIGGHPYNDDKLKLVT
jgi:hypothetical protein